MQTNTTTAGLRVTPIEDAAALLAGYADSQEFWLIVCDGPGFRSIEPILRRFYGNGDDRDLFAAISWSGEAMLATIIARRRRMSASKFKFELSKQGIATSARELVEAYAFIRVAESNRAMAWEFAREVLGVEPAADLAMEV